MVYIQEEIESRTVALSISTAKLTGRIFKAAICKYLAYRKEKKIQKSRDSMTKDSPIVPHGKQSVKQLIGQNQGVSTIEATTRISSLSRESPENTVSIMPSKK